MPPLKGLPWDQIGLKIEDHKSCSKDFQKLKIFRGKRVLEEEEHWTTLMLLSSMDFLQMAGAAFWDFTWKRTTEKMHILVKVEMIDGYNY